MKNMPRSCAKNCFFQILLSSGLMLVLASCAATRPPSISAPAYVDKNCQTAISAGVRALADFRREQVLTARENRLANYTGAREDLARALSSLRPATERPGMPEYERHALCFETALAAMDNIIAAGRNKDPHAEDVGWEMFYQSVSDLLLMLEPPVRKELQNVQKL